MSRASLLLASGRPQSSLSRRARSTRPATYFIGYSFTLPTRNGGGLTRAWYPCTKNHAEGLGEKETGMRTNRDQNVYYSLHRSSRWAFFGTWLLFEGPYRPARVGL